MADVSIKISLHDLDVIGSALDYKSNDLLLHDIISEDLDRIDESIWSMYFYMYHHHIKECELIADKKKTIKKRKR